MPDPRGGILRTLMAQLPWQVLAKWWDEEGAGCDRSRLHRGRGPSAGADTVGVFCSSCLRKLRTTLLRLSWSKCTARMGLRALEPEAVDMVLAPEELFLPSLLVPS